MKFYGLYFITAISVCFLILFLLGFSNGFSSNLPVLCLIGSLLLLNLAAPLTLFVKKIGVTMGVVFLLFMLPYLSQYLIYLFNNVQLKVQIILPLTPVILSIVSLIISVLELIKNKKQDGTIYINKTFKIILAILPITLTITYKLMFL